jgi:hypothetical protein
VAAPITHIVLADKVFEKYFPKKSKGSFYIGTSFPDIRYFGVIERDKTHFYPHNISQLEKLSSFETGLKFHALVDKVRENFVRSKKIYSLLPDSPFITQAIKFFEDRMLFEERANWEEIIYYFDTILDEEIAFGIKMKDLKKWHEYLKSYFSSPPCDQKVEEFVSTIERPKEMAYEIIRLNNIMSKSQEVKDIVQDLYTNFESLL